MTPRYANNGMMCDRDIRTMVMSAILALVFVLAVTPLSAQTYPDRPVKIVVPFAAGASVDIVARALARQLEAQMGRSFFIENRKGAGSQVGTAYVAKEPPDGYTLLFVDPSVVVNPTLRPDSSYQMSQLKTLATISIAPLIIAVHPSLPIYNLRDLIEYSKKQPSGVTYASPGIGTTPHLAPELLKVQSEFKATHIPYLGGGPSMVDLVAGRVQTAFYSTGTILPYIEDKSLRAIAQTGSHRSVFAPNIPTGVESGFPDFVVELWTALFAPAGLPPEIEKRLSGEIKKAFESQDFTTALKTVGLEPFYRDQPASEKFVNDEYDRWAGVIKAAHIVAN